MRKQGEVMSVYEVNWYVQHFGRMAFYISSPKPPTAGQVVWAFEQWWKEYIKGVVKSKQGHIRDQIENSFTNRRIEKLEVIACR